jgi:hypothetical protein
MHISRRAAAVAVAIFAGLGSLSAAGAAFASSPSGTHDSGQVLQFRTIGVSRTVNDAGHGGPGNVVALLFDIRTQSGAEAGTGYISCTIVTADEQLCHAGFVLAGGQIEAQAAIPLTAMSFPAAINGGTGIYEGVTGQVDNVVVAPGVIDRTFHLIRPSGD